MAQLFANNAYGVLAGTVNGAATLLVLVSGQGARFPAPTGGDYFLATLVGLDGNGAESVWEIVKCTGRSTDQLTVVRAQEGTTATTWTAGTRIEVRWTKEGINGKETVGVAAIAVATHVGLENPHTQYATKASPTFTGTVSGITKAMVGLPNADNTTDANKPISTATQTALDATVKRLDVGAAPAQVPAGMHLGRLAYMDELASLRATLVQPQPLGAVWVERVSDTSIKLFMRGSDGVARSTTLTLS